MVQYVDAIFLDGSYGVVMCGLDKDWARMGMTGSVPGEDGWQ